MAGLTPMMQQYRQVKDKHQDCILFYRLGDFYEMFFEDALLASKELELTLTGRDCGLEERAPMCGVPFHSADTYVQRLVERGYKVAICEQLTDPALSKGLVERDVVRIITPGTVVDPAMLQEKANAYLMCAYFQGDRAGLAMVDVSTGEFYVHQVNHVKDQLRDEVNRISPSEILTNDLEKWNGLFISSSYRVTSMPSSTFHQRACLDVLKEHFQVHDVSALGLQGEDKLLISASGAVMQYLQNTQRNALNHITGIHPYQGNGAMVLDRVTRRNLELTESLRGKGSKGTLLELLDKTSTAMGGRLLRSWIEYPLIHQKAVLARLDAVDYFVHHHVETMTLSDLLARVYDLERLLSKVAYQTLHGRDCLALMCSLKEIPSIQDMLPENQTGLIGEIRSDLDGLPDLVQLIEDAISPDCPLQMSEGGIIRNGYHAALDEYRSAAVNGKQWLLELEAREREQTGIRNLRIQYNRVFGYYIEVTKSYYEMVPARYIRKQTLANSERYMTPELKELETKILGAQEQGVRLELQLFQEIRSQISQAIHRIQRTAHAVKTLDAILSLAKVATIQRYVRPEITSSDELRIQDGRHPVVEAMMNEGEFISNDTEMNGKDARMLIITGPNMAGKSTYMRQVALIVLMAHIGSFVPASQASIPLTDRIFTRVGASDDLASGQSTFMVEMSETANILRHASRKSLVILDEIGRGTSTFDGLAIAWSVVEYINNPELIGAKTLFATHYHELSELEGHLPGVVNYNISVKERGEDVIFLRKIVPGGADKSFGIHVARLAGLPKQVLHRAREISARIEVSHDKQQSIGGKILDKQLKEQGMQVQMFDSGQVALIQDLKDVDVNAMTPMEALQLLYTMKERARNLP